MPHFYFHLWRGGQLTLDEVGVALPSLKAAKRRAERLAVSFLEQHEGAPMDPSGWDIEIIDASGHAVLIVPVGPGDLHGKPSQAA